MRRVARNHLNNSVAADEIATFRSELPQADSISLLRLLEARAAAAYWSSWRSVKISFPRNDIPRVPEHWRGFGTRVSPLSGAPRLAANPVNAILNYLYAVLESEARLAAAAVGLDPEIGMLHVDQQYRDSLACDLMEPVRPLVGEYVLTWLSNRLLKREWFFEQRDGSCRLTDALTGQLSCSSPTWARAVAPFAEWVAQVLWRTVNKGGYENPQLTTPLTKRRKSEGRGNSLSLEIGKTPQPSKLCKICGTPVTKANHCASCVRIAAREQMANVALIGQMKPRSAASQRRAEKKLSGHAVANTWFDPESLPPWLNTECYSREIHPKLKVVLVRELASAIGVSRPCAAQIRSGKVRPHPRHWQKLAEITGVSG